MSTRVGAVALAGVAALAAALGAGPATAAAATTWTVRPGGAITAHSGNLKLTDTATGTILTCSSTVSGTLKPGSGLSGAGIGSITAAAFHCPTSIGLFLLTPAGLPWHLNLASYNSRTGVSRGTIGHLQLTLTGPGCRAVVNGTSGTTANGVVAITYGNATSTLKILPAWGNLHWYHVHGCAGLVASGDPAALSGSYTVSPTQTITSP